MELVAVAIVFVLSSVLAGAAARGLMALTFFLLMRPAAGSPSPVPASDSQPTRLTASA